MSRPSRRVAASSPAIRHRVGQAGVAAEARRPLWRNPWVVAAVLGIMTITVLRPFLRQVPEAAPLTTLVSDFQLVDQLGRPFTAADLRGKAHVLGFFYGDCPDTCATQLWRLRELQDRYDRSGWDVGLLALTIDPRRDDVARLSRLAAVYGANPDRWRWLTGDAATIRRLADELGAPTGPPTRPEPGVERLPCSSDLFVLGAEGLRGRYEPSTEIDEIYHRAEHVALAERSRAEGG